MVQRSGNIDMSAGSFRTRTKRTASSFPSSRKGSTKGTAHFTSSMAHVMQIILGDYRKLALTSPTPNARGNLRCHWEHAYLQDGHFDKNRQLSLIERLLAMSQAERCTLPEPFLISASKAFLSKKSCLRGTSA